MSSGAPPKNVSAVSVVIPAFNVEAWVSEAIESVLEQDPAPLEVIVVDDGSADGTTKVVAGYGSITLISRDHEGVSSARNAGAASAVGEAVLFLDADDRLMPGFLERAERELRDHPGAAAVITNAWREVEGAVHDTFWDTKLVLRELRRRDAGHLIRHHWLHPIGVVRRTDWARHPFDESLTGAEDIKFWVDLLLSNRSVIVLGTPLAVKRVRRPGSATRDLAKMRANRRRFYRDLLTRGDLTRRERLTIRYRLVRSTIGSKVAARPGSTAGHPVSAAPEQER